MLVPLGLAGFGAVWYTIMRVVSAETKTKRSQGGLALAEKINAKHREEFLLVVLDSLRAAPLRQSPTLERDQMLAIFLRLWLPHSPSLEEMDYPLQEPGAT